MRLPWELKRDEDREGCYLYVDEPAGGYIDVGITGVYRKSLDSGEARRMADALLKAAERNDAYVPPARTEPVYATSGFTSPLLTAPAWLGGTGGA